MSRTRRRGGATARTARSNPAHEQIESRPAAEPAPANRAARLLATHGWALLLSAMVVVVALQLGALDWYASDRLVTSGGSTERLPNTFVSIDHPFHISKERAVLDALRDGDFPRWFSNHQAGYPIEFYPLGADVVVAAAWGLGFGQVPLEVVHKLVVIAILFIPVAAYWVIARRDDWPASVAVIAATLHLFVPGSWLGGGPDELLRMGMWPNVFAAYLLLPVMFWAADYLRHGSRSHLVLATSVASLAIYTNPRAAITVATVLLAVGTVVLADRRKPRFVAASTPRRDLTVLVQRGILLPLIVALMTAALIVPLRSHQARYEFSRFVEFSSFGKVWEYFSGAIPIEMMAIAAIGAVVAARTDRFHSRVLALWLPLAALVSVIAGGVLRDLSLFAQLEGPRLLPMVRLPALFLAAIAIHTGAQHVLRRITTDDRRQVANLAAVAVTAAFVLTPLSTLSANERGLPEIETTDQPDFTAIALTAQTYVQLATPADRALIVGSPLSDHASFWIPALTGANAFHAAWVWYWHIPDYADRTRLADTDSGLELDFLRRHALTMVLVATNDTENLNLAMAKPHLELVETEEPGAYAIFRVADAGPSVHGPVSVADGEETQLDVSREHLVATITAPQATEVRIAINDFPAWRATINGRASPTRRSEDGYMLVDIPSGDVVLKLTYTIEPSVWFGRGLTVLGVLVLAGIVVTPLIRRRPNSG
ncbi:MAG TPA: DUF6541 family protein [Thermomicrobiales bacterium]|nr:DUF6541 family protein [Thermomicrobiales bacterium]